MTTNTLVGEQTNLSIMKRPDCPMTTRNTNIVKEVKRDQSEKARQTDDDEKNKYPKISSDLTDK